MEDNIEKKYKDRFCIKPWSYININYDMNVFLCCPEWIKKTIIGNLKKESMEKIWNSSKAKKIRKSILDGSYKYCNKELCAEIQGNHLPIMEDAIKIENGRYAEIIRENKLNSAIPPFFIQMGFDWTCNLWCKSCRRNQIFHKKKEIMQFEKGMMKLVKFITGQDKEHVIKLNFSGSGDPFASKISRDFLFTFEGEKHPNIKICLQTNGILFDKNTWEKMGKIHNNIGQIIISVDAGSKEVYDKIRFGGNWNKLIDNLTFISYLNKEYNFEFVRLDFVVQKNNYKDMPEFIELCKKLGFKAYFLKESKWYNSPHYKDDMVCENDHPEFKEFINTLKNPIFSWNEIDFGNVTYFKDLALKELKNENMELYLQYIKSFDENNTKDQKNNKDKKEIWYNFRSYFVDKNCIKSLFNTDVVKLNSELIIKYDNKINKWVNCSPDEIKIYEEYKKNS